MQRGSPVVAPPIHTSVSSLLFIDLTVDDLQNLEFGKAQGELSLLVIVCGQSEASKRSLLASRVNTHTPANTYTHTLRTHTPCERGSVGERGIHGSRRQKWKPSAWLVLVYLPTSLSKGWTWYLHSLALAQKRYQAWDPSSPPMPVLYSSRNSITQKTLGSPNFSFPPRNTLSSSLPSPTLLPTPLFPHWKNRIACSTVHACPVRNQTALGSPPRTYQQLQIKSP